MPNMLAVKPQTYLQILKQSIQIYRYSFSQVFLVSFIISLIVFIPRFILIFIDPNYFNNISIFSLFFFIVLLWRMYSKVVGTNDKIREDLQIACKKIGLIIGAVLLQVVIF